MTPPSYLLRFDYFVIRRRNKNAVEAGIIIPTSLLNRARAVSPDCAHRDRPLTTLSCHRGDAQ